VFNVACGHHDNGRKDDPSEGDTRISNHLMDLSVWVMRHAELRNQRQHIGRLPDKLCRLPRIFRLPGTLQQYARLA
jgi:hypothetical protein